MKTTVQALTTAEYNALVSTRSLEPGEVYIVDGEIRRATSTSDGQVVAGGDLYRALAGIGGVVAFWDFSEARAPFASKIGYPHLLRQGPGSRVRKSNGGPLGHSIVLNGTSDYLLIPAAEVGTLNLGANGAQGCYVMAWVKRESSSGTCFIGGIWRENDNTPQRQYGLFLDLPIYGGDNKVCMHISRNGGSSPGIPYSRDYSANGAQEPSRDWVSVSGWYDGQQIKSYIEGRFEPYTNYTEPGAPNGQGLTYDKNPYIYPDGLNTQAADFTVGAVELTDGMGNFMLGEIAALLVMSRAPSESEIAQIQMLISGAGWGFKNRLFKWLPGAEAIGGFGVGYSAYRGSSAVDDTANAGSNSAMTRAVAGSPANAYMLRQAASTGIGMMTCTSVPPGITTDNLDSVQFQAAFANTNDAARLCLRIGTAWYATNGTYGVSGASPSSSDWTNAEVKVLTFSRAAAEWRDVTLVPGSTLSVAGAARSADLPSGAVTGWGILMDGTPTGSQRFRDVELNLL